MTDDQKYEWLAVTISSLDRGEVENRIRNFQGSFKFDFTEEYLKSLTVDRLRHILFAAMTSKLRKNSN
jgi:hypothetical protein